MYVWPKSGWVLCEVAEPLRPWLGHAVLATDALSAWVLHAHVMGVDGVSVPREALTPVDVYHIGGTSCE